MFKVFNIKTPKPELNGLWGIEITKRTGIIHIKMPDGKGGLKTAIQIAPGYNKPFNSLFYKLDEDVQKVIKKLTMKVTEEKTEESSDGKN